MWTLLPMGVASKNCWAFSVGSLMQPCDAGESAMGPAWRPAFPPRMFSRRKNGIGT